MSLGMCEKLRCNVALYEAKMVAPFNGELYYLYSPKLVMLEPYENSVPAMLYWNILLFLSIKFGPVMPSKADHNVGSML